jgi:hypothetical protein
VKVNQIVPRLYISIFFIYTVFSFSTAFACAFEGHKSANPVKNSALKFTNVYRAFKVAPLQLKIALPASGGELD